MINSIEQHLKGRLIKNKIMQQMLFMLGAFVLSLGLLLIAGLWIKANPLLQQKGFWSLLLSLDWHPSKGQFGLGPFILGTLIVTGIAVVLAVPLSLLTAIFLSEYCSKRVRDIVRPIIDLLAGISPVVYGVWGMVVIVPFVRDFLMPFFNETFPFFPFLSENYTGFSAIAAGVVLAVMISPLIISVVEEILRSLPISLREASLSLGATRFETTKYVVLRKAATGIVAAIILGLSRAIGETMAVLMVAGCALGVSPRSIFDSVYPLSALIANTYGEMMSIPLYDAAILTAAFILLLMTVVFNVIAWMMLLYLEKKAL